MRWLAAAGTALLTLTLLNVPPASAHPRDVRATYGQPIRRADGHVDAWATIGRLRTLGAYTYAFQIRTPQDWDDLRLDFAPAAEEAGIEVWVYLLPPGICPGDEHCSEYGPYFDDYEQWADAIARLSNQYHVVTAWVMDDFATRQSLFTPEYVSRIRQSSRAIQPRLEFYPIVYYRSMTATFLDKYAALVDSMIMPFRDDPYRNTLWTASLTGQLNNASALLAAHGRQLILMVYVWPLSNTQIAPDVEYVRRVTATGMDFMRAGKIAGVIQYHLPLALPGRSQRGDHNYSHGTGRGALVFTVRAEQKTAAGNYAAASTTIRLLAPSNNCQINLWHYDNRGAPSARGHHFKQVLINGRLVWERDVSDDEPAWRQTPWLNLWPHFIGANPATLTLRLYEKAGVSNFNVRVQIDDITLSGCTIANRNLETVGGWNFSRSGGPVLSGQNLYDPVFTETVFNTVDDLYSFN